MSVYPLGNMHPMGGEFDDNDQSVDDLAPAIARPCPTVLPNNNPNNRFSLQPLQPWDRFIRLAGAGRIFQAIDDAIKLNKYNDYDDAQSPVGVIMGERNVAMTIRVSQIPEAVLKGWALLGVFDESTGNKIVSEVGKAFSLKGSVGFPTIYYQFTQLAFPKLIKLHYAGQMLGICYAKFLDKIARQISFYSGRNGFNKFFKHYFQKVKDAYRYPLAFRTIANPLP